MTATKVATPAEVAQAVAVHRVLAAVVANPDAITTVDEMAKTAGYSRFYFVQVFRAHAGMTPVEYLRLDRAEQYRVAAVEVIVPKVAAPTEQELQVLRWVAQGATGRQIARALGVARSTPPMIMFRLRAKLDARTTAHAVYLACQQGLLPMPAAAPPAGGHAEGWTECTR